MDFNLFLQSGIFFALLGLIISVNKFDRHLNISFKGLNDRLRWMHEDYLKHLAYQESLRLRDNRNKKGE